MKPLLFRAGLAALLFVISATIGLIDLRGPNATLVSFDSFASISIPGAASALFLGFALFVSPIVPSEKLRYPLNLSLPLIHVSLIFIVAHLLAMREASIVTQPPGMEPILAWTGWRLLVKSLLGEALVLSAIAAIGSRGRR